MAWKFVYVWGLKGPEGQVWNDDVKRDQKPLGGKQNEHDISEAEAKLPVSHLIAKYPCVIELGRE